MREGEIVCIAGIDGNGQTELDAGDYRTRKDQPVAALRSAASDISARVSRKRSMTGMSHIPEDRHKHGLGAWIIHWSKIWYFRSIKIRSFRIAVSLFALMKCENMRTSSIEEYDVRSGQGPVTTARSMSGGNQQKAIIARELDRDAPLIIAVQPTQGPRCRCDRTHTQAACSMSATAGKADAAGIAGARRSV